MCQELIGKQENLITKRVINRLISEELSHQSKNIERHKQNLFKSRNGLLNINTTLSSFYFIENYFRNHRFYLIFVLCRMKIDWI